MSATTEDPTKLPEPEVPASRPPRVGLVLLVAAAGALAASGLAPAPWPDGEGEVRLLRGDETLARTPIELADGASPPVRLQGTRGRRSYTVSFPRGITARSEVRATILVQEDGRVLDPARHEDALGLGEVRLEVGLSDGRTELVPVLRRDEIARGPAGGGKDPVLRAGRRPPVDAHVVLGLLCLIVVLWVTEVIPLYIAALVVPVVLVATGVAGARAALAPFFHPIIALFFGGFMMAEAMRRVRLDHLAAVTLVTWGGRNPVALFGTILGVSAFLSMWMSNTASTAVLLPIVLAVTLPLGSRPFTKMAVLGLAYAATIGGVGSAVGTPANPIAIDFLDTFANRKIAFVDWFAFGLPMVVIFVPIMGAYLWWRMGVKLDRAKFRRARWVALREYARVRRPSREQWTVIAVFAGVMVAWLTQTWHGVHVGVVALAGVVVLGVLGKLESEDLGRISWAALITFGGGITLGVFMVQSGTSDWVATRLEALAGLPSFLAVAAVAVLALALTAVASNTATAAMLVPLAIPLATVLHIDPVLLVVVVAIASSVDFALVIGTPPTMIAYSTRLFTAREIFRYGIVLDVIGILILVTAVVGLWYLIGVL